MPEEEVDTERKSLRTNASDQWMMTIMMAITFAEAGDAKTARNITGESPRKRNEKQNRREIESRIDQRPRLRE
jgi:thioredoxin-like negative regulator of GroEL